MITVEIIGGLGNQLFQIFALISIALEQKISFYFENKEIEFGSRKVTYWNNILSNISKFQKSNIKINDIIRERGYNYNEIPKLNSDKTIKLMGYFQSYKYFEKNYEGILKLIKFNDQILTYTNLYDYKYSISMHFRLGDYKNLTDHHPILNINYYIKALTLILSSCTNSWQILYFCEDEDIEIVNENIQILEKNFSEVTFLRVPNTFMDWEQMIIMSLCTHNIIANSTFSWWGAYLNLNENKIVCYPTTWFGKAQGYKNMTDLFPLKWNKINE